MRFDLGEQKEKGIGILVRILAEPQANFSTTGESQVGQNNPLILLVFV
jgi:hypothetical protein